MKVAHGLSVAAVVVGVLGLAGCSTPGESPTASVPAPSTQVTQGDISPVLPPIPELNNAQGIRSSISMDQCAVTAGPVTASGKATNTTDKSADVVVVVEWVTAASDVMARGIAVLKAVAHGASQTWSASAQLDSKNTVSCVPTAQLGTLK